MAGARTATIWVERLVLETGHWCRTCHLPSGLRQVVAVRTVTTLRLSTAARCLDCGGTDVEVDPLSIGRTR